MAKKSSNTKARYPKDLTREDDFLVVGVGASAGGIKTLKQFFSKVPKDSGFAYVVILHLSPEHESKLAEILQVSSRIPVTQVKDQVKVAPNHVYVIPPNQNLVMSDGHLTLADMIGVEERRSPVDLFFRTLGETNERRAVSVILSGSGADGSLGLKLVKEHGGVVFVQDPNEAEYTDMPRNAIATGLVDYILPVSEIPAKIISFGQHRDSILLSAEAQEIPRDDEHALQEIFSQLRVRTGHDFSNYKRATMLRRIERRLGLKELSGLSAYAQFLKDNPGEAQALMKDLLISVTSFFRDPKAIDSLANTVFPKLLKRKRENDGVRVWVAGCATGEEAYTIGMLLSEAVSTLLNSPQIQLFATDLDADAIAVAREGFYNEAEVADVSPERLSRYFIKESQGYRVRRELREMVLFAVHNVIKDPPFSRLDLISCRNLLIYLDRTAQVRVLERLHFALNPMGFLFLGGSESVESAPNLFSTFDKEHHIFQSGPVHSRATFPVYELTARPPLPSSTDGIKEVDELKDPLSQGRLSYADLHQRMLEQLAPPSIIINEEYDILHMSERAGRYLQFGGGEPSRNLLNVVRPELRTALRAALYQSVQNRSNFEHRGLTVKTDDGLKAVNIQVRPVFREGDMVRGFILVLFEETEQDPEVGQQNFRVKTSGPFSQHLEDELIQSKAQLRATIEQHEIQQEELRASNEELQAMNEELRSAAEELETSKEELQSLNEELTTVNQELKIKIEELSQANNDFTNLINSTDIGTIFLDRSLRVKQFTPRARDAFNLIPGDVGRPLMDITNKLDYDNLLADVEQVLTSLSMIERQVQNDHNQWYGVRILPYRTAEDRIDGVVLTLMDITESKLAKDELERVRGELEAKVVARTDDLARANSSLWMEVSERRQSEAARVKLLDKIVTAQEDERRRLARDLHDQLGQQLTAMRLKLDSLKRKSGQHKDWEKEVQGLLDITARLDSDVDFLAWELRPIVLDDLGLAEALRNYVIQWAEHFGKAAEFHATGFDAVRLTPEVESNLYRIAQEALNNVAKHSKCSRVDVLLERRDHHGVLIIEDNGTGFDVELDGGEGLGLTGMRERASLVGGSLEVESAHMKGTTIFVRVPLKKQSSRGDKA